MNHDQSHTPEPQEPVIASCKPRRGLGELLRSVAGATAGWRPNRRGSFLVLVVGTLALLAVMALIYSSIGTHDKQMTSAGAKRDRMNDVPQQVANYITALISEDTLSTYYESRMFVPNNIPVPLLRKVSDYPSTTWVASSTATAPNAAGTIIPFNPTGSVSGFLTMPSLTEVGAGSMPKSWAPSSPWLSSTEATFLNYNGNAPMDVNRPYLDNHDIAHISNIAPDGRFVNLVNLRNNFSASPAVMCQNLTLFGDNGQAPPGSATTDFGLAQGPNFIPAMFDSRQRWMFRAARPTVGKVPGNKDYEPNQYASPDGSGMYTVRWQELKDGRFGDPFFGTDILHTDGKYRFFVSARIIDASALVNVNTACDLHAAPTVYAPAGSSVADIDLARVLSLYDSYATNVLPGNPLLRAGYDGIFQPASGVPSFYGATGASTGFPPANTNSGYDQIRAEIAGRDAYTSLRLALGGGTIPPDSYRGGSLSANFPTDYPLPLRSWDAASTPSSPYLGFADPYLRAEFYRSKALAFGDTVVAAAGGKVTFTGGFGINDLAELITWRSANDPTFTSPLEMAIDGRDDTNMAAFPSSTRFGPLRSNRGLDVEHDRRYTFPLPPVPASGSDYDRTMLHFATDIRQRLTTISGGRDFRQVPTVVNTTLRLYEGVAPDQLSDQSSPSFSELRIDVGTAMSKIKTADTNLASNPSNITLQRKKAEAINAIFNGYADALLPTSGVDKAWASGPTAARRQYEFYGRKGPELAAHVAAHMAVNMIDMFDIGGVPTVQTLVLSRSAAAVFLNSAPAAAAFPTWVRTSPTWKSNGLELPDSRLGDPGDPVLAPAINIYGIEAQPFLTQVATFTVYADSTFYPGGGDDDANSPTHEITIRGNLDYTGNHDLMYQVVAFQLTNPFGVDIQLGSPPGPIQYSSYDWSDPNYPDLDREPNFYYIKFGDRTFKLASVKEATYTAAAAVPGYVDPTRVGVYIQGVPAGQEEKHGHIDSITIPAGKSIVCYALSDVPRRILANRLAKISQGTSSTDAGTYFNQLVPAIGNLPRYEFSGELKLAIEHQLGAGDAGIDAVYWVPEMDAVAGSPTQGKVIIPKNANIFPAAVPKDVSLWRAMRYSGDEATQAALNLPGRYWDDSAATNPPSPKAPGHNDISNDQLVDRMHMPLDPGGNLQDIRAKLHDDTPSTPNGNTVIGTGSGTRPDSGEPGTLYMIATHASVRRKADPSPPLGAIPGYCLEPKFALSWNFYESDGLGLRTTIPKSQFTSSGPNFEGGGTSVVQWLLRMGSTPIGGTYAFIKAPVDIAGPLIDPASPNGESPAVAYKTLYPQININDAEFQVDVPTTAAPAGTKVSTLRIADMLLPLGIGPEEMPFDKNNAPVTDDNLKWTTLSEALALAMGYQPPPVPATARDATYPYFVDLTIPGNKMPLDRGNLRLDDSVPFYNQTGDGVFNPATDQRLGLQIPLALNVLDIFTVYPVDNRSTGVFTPLAQTLTTPSHGKININTASTQTIRSSLSMLSPPPQKDDLGPPGNGNPWWWWTTQGGVQPPLNGPGGLAGGPPPADIAATVTAYRDKYTNMLRPASRFTSTGGVTVDDVAFGDFAGVTPNAQESFLNGRASTTQIGIYGPTGGTPTSSLHERPGFSSIAELALPRISDSGNPPDPSAPSWPTNMDFLGHDQLPVPVTTGTAVLGNSSIVGLDSVLYPAPNPLLLSPPPPPIPDAVPNDYKEQLEILNSVIGNVSTRSDYFIVWFQIQGYQKSDVENLGPNDPMIPSINRRFVMVVDRSKVTTRGDKADVLLFKEVPVDTH